jgi:metal-responsive CopG/Arc/MetJ family transcriptional regulator
MKRKTVAFDNDLLNELNHFAKKDQRDFSSALRYALRIGLAAIENPEMSIDEIRNVMDAKVDYQAGRIMPLEIEKI